MALVGSLVDPVDDCPRSARRDDGGDGQVLRGEILGGEDVLTSLFGEVALTSRDGGDAALISRVIVCRMSSATGDRAEEDILMSRGDIAVGGLRNIGGTGEAAGSR